MHFYILSHVNISLISKVISDNSKISKEMYIFTG